MEAWILPSVLLYYFKYQITTCKIHLHCGSCCHDYSKEQKLWSTLMSSPVYNFVCLVLLPFYIFFSIGIVCLPLEIKQSIHTKNSKQSHNFLMLFFAAQKLPPNTGSLSNYSKSNIQCFIDQNRCLLGPHSFHDKLWGKEEDLHYAYQFKWILTMKYVDPGKCLHFVNNHLTLIFFNIFSAGFRLKTIMTNWNWATV